MTAALRAIALLYDAPDENVRRHLVALASRIETRPGPVWDVLAGVATATPVLLTFDDHGHGVCGRMAELLEAFSWRGHFFVTPGFIGAPGFLAADQIRALTRRGHLVGIHGPRADVSEEWHRGARVLRDILRAPVCLGSVSRSYNVRPAAAAAAAAGLQVLFTSDPTARPAWVDGCLVLGRYTIDETMPPRAILPWVRFKLAKALGVAV